MQLTATQISGINKALRQYELETGGDQFATFLQAAILDVLYGGSLGIAATAADVDSLAKGGGAFTWNADATTLNFTYGIGRFHNGKTAVTVAGGTIALSASATNYVEVDRAGTVSKNTTAFTSGRLPLYVVVTGSSTISTVVSAKTLLTLIGPNGVDGSMLSTPGQTKEAGTIVSTVTTAAGDTYAYVRVPKSIAAASKTTSLSVTFKDALAASDTNYVKFQVTNLGVAGAGTQVLVDNTAAANSTKVTGGTAIAAKTPRELTLVTVSGGTERDVLGGDLLELKITAVGALANTLTLGRFDAEFTFAN
jgi:hypothetical protein